MSELSDHDKLLCREAVRLSRQGRFSDAEEIFDYLTYKNPHNSSLNWIFGYECLRGDSPIKAIDCFHRSVSLDPQCAPAWGGLGRAFMNTMRWREAESALRRRLDLGESANHYVFLAMALSRQLKYKEALLCCERAIQLDENQLDAYVNQSFAYSELGLYERAVESCRKAIAIDDRYGEAYVCLGVVSSKAGRLEDASEAFQHAIDIDPKCAPAYREFGLLQYIKGDLMLAESYLRSSLELDSLSEVAHDYLRLVLRKARKRGGGDEGGDEGDIPIP